MRGYAPDSLRKRRRSAFYGALRDFCGWWRSESWNSGWIGRYDLCVRKAPKSLFTRQHQNAEDADENGRVKRAHHTVCNLSADRIDSRMASMSCGPSAFFVTASSQRPAHVGIGLEPWEKTGTTRISREYERYSFGIRTVTVSLPGFAKVRIAGMVSTSLSV